MAYEIRPDYSDGDNTPVDTSGTYLDLNPNQAIYDPGFLTDMRDFLEENGESPYLSDDEVRDKFFSDAVWRNLNTYSAISGAFESSGYSEEQKARARRLDQLYNSYPDPWQDGGRGWEGIGQGALAIAADPLTYVPLASAGAKAKIAAQAAMKAGESTMRAGIKQGAITGAKGEGALGLATGAITDAAVQAREINIDARDSYNPYRTALMAGGEGLAGLGLGGAIGAGAGAIAARNVNTAGVGRAATQSGNFEEVQGGQPLIDYSDFDEPAVTRRRREEREFAESLSGEEAESVARQNALASEIALEEEELTRMVQDGMSPEDIADQEELINTLREVEQVEVLLANKADQVESLLGSNVEKDLNTGRSRQALLTQRMAEYRSILNAFDEAKGGRVDMDEVRRRIQQFRLDVDEEEAAEAAAEAATETATETPATGTPAEADEVTPADVVSAAIEGRESGSAPAPSPEGAVTPAPEVGAGPSPQMMYRVTDPAGNVMDGFGRELEDGVIEGEAIMPDGSLMGFSTRDGQAKAEATGKSYEEYVAEQEAGTPTKTASTKVVNETEKTTTLKFSSAAVKREFTAKMDELGLTDDQVREYIASGRIKAGKTGGIVKGSLDDLTRISTTEALEAADAVEATPLTPKMRAFSLSLGIDPDRAAQEGWTSRRELRNNAPSNPDAYSAKAEEDLSKVLDVIVQMAEGEGAVRIDVTDPATLARAVRMTAGITPNVSTRPEDLEALALFRSTQDARGKADDFMLPSPVEVKDFTATEKKKLRKKQAALRKENPELTVEEVNRQAVQFIVEEREATLLRGQTRGTGDRIKQAHIFTTAGENNQGKIQGIIRQGRAIAPDSDYTVTESLRYNEGFQEALVKARTAGEMDLQPFRATDNNTWYLNESGQKVRMKKGDLGYADGITNRAFATKEMALRVRDGKIAQPTLPETPEPAVSTPTDELNSMLIKALSDGDEQLFQKLALQKLRGVPDLPDSIKTDVDNRVSRETAQVAEAPTGENLIIAKSKLDGSIRMMSPKQKGEGKTLLDIIGQKAGSDSSNPDNWIVRYAPEESYTRSTKGKQALFDSLEEQATVKPDSPEVRRNADPVSIGEIESIEVTFDSPQEEIAVLKTYANFTGRTSEYLGESGDTYTIADLLDMTDALENQSWATLIELGEGDGAQGVRDTIDAIAILQRHIEKGAPGGVQRETADIETSISQLEGILGGHEPETLAQVSKLLRALKGGDKPVFSELFGTHNGQYDPITNRVKVKQGNTESLPTPNSVVIFHEIGHWAYTNLLTNTDRAEFWSHMQKAYTKKGNLNRGALKRKLYQYEGMEGLSGGNQMESPAELFAEQFALWVSKGIVPEAAEEGFWRRMSGYLEAIFHRFVHQTKVDPNLEKIFAKLIDDPTDRARGKGIEGAPQTERGKYIVVHYDQLRDIRGRIESGMAEDNPERIIDAATELANYILRAAPIYKRGQQGSSTGTFSPYAKLWPVMHSRLGDIDEIRGSKFNYEQAKLDENTFRNEHGYEDTGGMSFEDMEGQAEKIADLYEKGYGGVFVPEEAKLTDDGKVILDGKTFGANNTGLKFLLDMMESNLAGAYAGSEKGAVIPGYVPRDNPPARTKQSKQRNKMARQRLARERTTVDALAKADANQKRSDAVNKPETVNTQTAPSLKSMDIDQLRTLLVEQRGTEYGRDVAKELYKREKDAPILEAVPIPEAYKKFGDAEIQQELFDALYESDSKRISQASYEIRRRAENRRQKRKDKVKYKPIVPTYYSRGRLVPREISDNTGVSASDGIPPSARASIRNLLSYITHRDPEIETTSRTLAYRMLNLMGKTDSGTLDNLNVVDARAIADLAGTTPEASGSFPADYRSSEFKRLRTEMRRTAIALNKGGTSPFDIIKSINDMVIRSGAMDADEMAAFRAAYDNLPDSEKDRLFRAYSSKYENRVEPLDSLLASEYVSEQLTLYMGERVAKGDIFKAAVNGDPQSLILKNPFERALDKMVEFTAYSLNGLVGRNDIKQQFRRLFLYGNMFSENSFNRKPLAQPQTGVISARNAAGMAADTFDSRSDVAKANIVSYQSAIAQLLGRTSDERPVVFYHGTTSGQALNHLKNPNVQLIPSEEGYYGPGNYFTINPMVADESYAGKGTYRSYWKIIDELDLPAERADELKLDVQVLHQLERNISRARVDYATLEQDFTGAVMQGHLDRMLARMSGIRNDYYGAGLGNKNFPETSAQIQKLSNRKSDIMEDFSTMIASDVEQANLIRETLSEEGIKIEPMVIPVYVGVKNIADFRKGTLLEYNSPLVQAVIGQMQRAQNIDKSAIANLTAEFGDNAEIDAGRFYSAIQAAMGGKTYASGNAVNNLLQDAGYDSLVSTHSNTLVKRQGALYVLEDGVEVPVSGQSTDHMTLVVFPNAGKSNTLFKHINSFEFDADENRLFGGGDQPIPPGISGGFLDMVATGKIEDLSEINAGAVSELAEFRTQNSSGTLINSLLRKRTLNEREMNEIHALSPTRWISRSSERMNKMGLRWLGNWYRDSYPDVSQRFAKKFFPLLESLNGLPDSKGRIKRWAHKSSADIMYEQPKSHTKIVKALRYGEDSRFYNALSKQEQDAFHKIRGAFDAERSELVSHGVNMGVRRNYLPQVWNNETIERNRTEFIEAMIHYHKVEATARGEISDGVQATKFAEDMFMRLTDQGNDGTYIPGGGSQATVSTENIDFTRMIELEKYPEALGRLEKFLESDLEFLLTKYFEASSRRMTYLEKFGERNHGLNDYMMVKQEGAAGIAQLLSKNKNFTDERKVFNRETGQVEEISLKDSIYMPFQGREAEAYKFSEELVRVHQQGGSPAAREVLQRIAPVDSSGRVHPTYERRVDAIIGALEDFGGRPSDTNYEDRQFVTNAFRLGMKKAPEGTNKTAANISSGLRTLNNITLLGFTTLTSMSDFVLPLVKTGDWKAFGTNLAKFAMDKDHRRSIYNVGAAVESIAHNRMIHMYGQVHNRASDAFFNATLLTPWTDTMRLLATGVGHEAFRNAQVKMRRSYKPGLPVNQQPAKYRTQHRIFMRYGLTDFLPDGPRFNENIGDIDMHEDSVYRIALNKFTNDTVFAPNPDDIPMWANTPFGAIMFQLKSFPLMMGRMMKDNLTEATKGNLAPLVALMTAGVGSGVATLAAKDVVQRRGGEDDRSAAYRERGLKKSLGLSKQVHGDVDEALGWAFEGFAQLGGLGLFSDVLYNAAASSDDGAYGQVTMISRIGGPTVGLGIDTLRLFGGAKDLAFREEGDPNGQIRQAVRVGATRIPVAGGIRDFREGVVDTIAGEPVGRRRKAPANFDNSNFTSDDFKQDFGESDF